MRIAVLMGKEGKRMETKRAHEKQTGHAEYTIVTLSASEAELECAGCGAVVLHSNPAARSAGTADGVS